MNSGSLLKNDAGSYLSIGSVVLEGRVLTIAELASEQCKPCERVSPMSEEEARAVLEQLPGWLLKSGSIEKEFRFRSYIVGLDFAYSLGRIAERENHHPDMLLGWHRVRVTLSTHSIKGLSQNDLIMAAKAELEYSKMSSH